MQMRFLLIHVLHLTSLGKFKKLKKYKHKYVNGD